MVISESKTTYYSTQSTYLIQMNPPLVLRKRVKKIGRQKNKDNRKFRLYKIQIVYTGRALEMLAFHKWDTFGML